MPYDPAKPARIHSRPPPPSWQRRSRWFPHIDAGDALVLSAITLGVVAAYILVVAFSLGPSLGASHPVIRNWGIALRPDGYAFSTAGDQLPSPHETSEVGGFVWSVRTERRGCFGPFPVVERHRAAVWIFLNGGHTLTRQQAEQLIAAAPGAVQGYSFDSPTGIAKYEPSMVEFEFAAGPASVQWSRIALNTMMWLSLALAGWSLSWFAFSVRVYFDPRRKRAAKLAANLCPRCDYDIRMIDSKQCPECGDALTIEPERRSRGSARNRE